MNIDEQLENILIRLRAGNDADTKQPHITWDEAKSALKKLIQEIIKESLAKGVKIGQDEYDKILREKLSLKEGKDE